MREYIRNKKGLYIIYFRLWFAAPNTIVSHYYVEFPLNSKKRNIDECYLKCTTIHEMICDDLLIYVRICGEICFVQI